MNMLRLGIYFEPENIAGSHMNDDFYNGLKEHEIHCDLIVPVPSRGISKEVRRQYQSRKIETLYDGCLTVHRFPMNREGRNPIWRTFHYLLCNICEYSIGVRQKNVQVVYSSSTPPTQGMLSALVAKKLSKRYRKKVPFIYDLQDIFPDSLITTGMTHQGSFLWKLGRRIENYTYRNADKIITISQSMKRNIMAKGVPEEKIEVISNWIDMDSVHPEDRKDNRLVSEFEIDPNKFIVVYAGNFGAAQGADIVLKAAKQLVDNKDIQFVIFGGGAYFDDAMREARSLYNVMIHELMPIDRVSEVYSLGDVALITCKKGVGTAGMPSKTWSIMACNTPIIASFDTESDLADVIKESGGGQCVEPGNVKALAEAIEKTYNEWKQGKHINIDTRTYALKTASKDVCVQKYVNTLLSVAPNK